MADRMFIHRSEYRHKCRFPRGHRGDLYRCECGRWWYHSEAMPLEGWYRVRWWHWRLRRVIRERECVS